MRRTVLKVVLILGCCLFSTLNIWQWLNISEASGAAGENRVDYLYRILDTSPDFKVRIAAATELGKVANGTVADWMLRTFRKEKNNAVRLTILYSIANIPDHLILAPLIELSTQEFLSEEEQIAVERTLWNFRRAFSANAWAKALMTSGNREERAIAAYVLGLVSDRSAIPVLANAITADPIAHVRTRVAQAIGRLGMKEGRAICERAARRDSDVTVRRTAQLCVGEIELSVKGKIDPSHVRRTQMKLNLKGLQPQVFTPEVFQEYLKQNVNPRTLDQAVANLQKDEVVKRADKTYPIVKQEEFKRTIRYNADITTNYFVDPISLNRIRSVIKDNATDINICFMAGLKDNRRLSGNVTAQFMVLESGEVSTVEITDFTLDNKEVHNCIIEKIRSMNFPKTSMKYVSIKNTFTFIPPKDAKYKFDER